MFQEAGICNQGHRDKAKVVWRAVEAKEKVTKRREVL